jgi:NAD dependent epimerase/dehydratase family enzyme
LKLNIITGNKGFVGVNLSKYLKYNNKRTKGISRKPLGDGVSYNDLNLEVFNTAKSCIHLAGKAHDFKKKHQMIKSILK